MAPDNPVKSIRSFFPAASHQFCKTFQESRVPRPKSRAEEIISGNEAFVGTKEAAAMLGVSVSTIQKMVESGKLRAWRTQGGHRRIAQVDVKSLHHAGMQAAGGPARKSLTILIVEDNPTMVKAYAKVAAQWGDAVELSFAVDAVSALLQIAQRLPKLVITDLAMTPFDGFHLIRTMRAAPELADTRVLVVTGLSDQEIADRGGLLPGFDEAHVMGLAALASPAARPAASALTGWRHRIGGLCPGAAGEPAAGQDGSIGRANQDSKAISASSRAWVAIRTTSAGLIVWPLRSWFFGRTQLLRPPQRADDTQGVGRLVDHRQQRGDRKSGGQRRPHDHQVLQKHGHHLVVDLEVVAQITHHRVRIQQRQRLGCRTIVKRHCRILTITSLRCQRSCRTAAAPAQHGPRQPA